MLKIVHFSSCPSVGVVQMLDHTERSGNICCAQAGGKRHGSLWPTSVLSALKCSRWGWWSCRIGSMSDAVAEVMEVLVIINSKGRMQRKSLQRG